MKIKTIKKDLQKALAIPEPKHRIPHKPSILFRSLTNIAATPDLLATKFKCRKENMERAGKGPWLILMNHSSFIDLEIAFKIFYPKPFCTVATHDAFVGKPWLMRRIGCIPTKKFVSDSRLIADIKYTLHELNTSVLMFPEAGYSFDGTATALPQKLGVLLKMLKVPVVHVQTYGAFARDPLYNGLQKRKVEVSATVTCLLTKEEIAEKSIKELDSVIDEAFSFDSFRWQKENNIEINEDFRADGLGRILYKCPACKAEGRTEGKGTTLTCKECGKVYELDPLGELHALEGETEFSHIPDWYEWEREEVKKEILAGEYNVSLPVDIGIMADYNGIYMVGEGTLTHSADGFTLIGCDGELEYHQSPKVSHTLNSDYFWYELGDVICIGENDRTYCCFPKEENVVTKPRLATEELYKLTKRRRKKECEEPSTNEATEENKEATEAKE